ncbi:cytochrome P450 [Gonapodya prolifera JEL478]|uniref:Cytochrome P450 n=1 Tax=Gonapodya prolifera (strain JEL478) TaxID=1344416 RepID=A0A139AUS7_GONPJ|nr:cytochrome P450 [Gonapodya prolifera JEL478]|eukprot:KXS20467.1 cytochrome P450 [Gonapodya prolifera JEL478]
MAIIEAIAGKIALLPEFAKAHPGMAAANGLLIIFLAIWCVFLYQYLVVSPLRKVPGEIYYVVFGGLMLGFERYFLQGGDVPHMVRNFQHYKYGPVVRIGPTSVSVADPEIAREVLLTQDLPKSTAAQTLFGPLHPDALVVQTDKAEHKIKRRFFSQRFSIVGIQQMEPLMQIIFRNGEKKLDALIKEGKRVDIWDLLHCVGIDIIGITAFDQSFHAVEDGHHQTVGGMVESMFKWLSRTASYPLLRSLPLPSNSVAEQKLAYLQDFCRKIIKERRQLGQRKNDVLDLLVDGRMPDSEDGLPDSQIVNEMMGVLTAGADSTATAMSFLMIDLLQNPHYMVRVIDEVLRADPDPKTGLLHASTVKDLPWFNACVKESLRMNTGRDFQRVALQEGTMVGPYYMPAGTEVNVSRYCLHRGPWWRDPNTFIAERFLPAELGGLTDTPAEELGAYAPFSLGTRSCIGKNFAWQEIRIMIANFLRTFEFEDVPGQDISQGLYITLMLKNPHYFVRVKRRTPEAIAAYRASPPLPKKKPGSLI